MDSSLSSRLRAAVGSGGADIGSDRLFVPSSSVRSDTFVIHRNVSLLTELLFSDPAATDVRLLRSPRTAMRAPNTYEAVAEEDSPRSPQPQLFP